MRKLDQNSDTKRLAFRLTATDLAAVDVVAQRRGLTRSELLREVVGAIASSVDEEALAS